MTPNVFLTGATGYVGGTILAQLVDAHPDYGITVLVRNEERGKPVKKRFPSVKLAYGSLDDSTVVEKEAAEADIVIHAADSADSVPGASAIAKGLKAGHTAEKPGYWIHLSGTSILTWYDAQNHRHGEAPIPEQKYEDVTDIERLISLPDEAHHRNVDKIVQASVSDAVKPLIVCPPTIYGTGRGPVNTRSVQVPNLALGTLEKGFAPFVGAGKTEWDHVHIDDVVDLILKLVDATQDPLKRDDPEIFGLHAYYFAENGSHKWSEVATWIAEEAARQGYLPEALTKSVSQKEVDMLGYSSTASWGRNSKGVAQRARKHFGWKPKAVSLKETIPEAVAREAKALGYTPKEKIG